MKRNEKVIDKLIRYLKHGWYIYLWGLYDTWLWIKCSLNKEEYIGVHLKIMTPRERDFYFTKNVVGGGYASYVILKLFCDKKWMTTELVEDFLNHEVLHQVLGKRIGEEAKHKLDNIHKVRVCSEIGVPSMRVDFVEKFNHMIKRKRKPYKRRKHFLF